jgi:hypothetical protein
VRYYLMYQVDVASFDIKEFPKLNNFVKRYLQEQGARERVAYEGKQFIRQLLYSLVLFPEKAKELKLDPMRVNVTYDLDGERDPFGFGRGRLVSKTLSSKTIDIEVLKIPAERLPTGYTGLVGKHKFSLSMNKTKFLVNEPIEIKLKVIGNGNLEGADAPPIIQDPAIESFDANSSFEIIDATNASKTFEYTYLPRKETRIPAQKIPLSYFNPEIRQFETAEVDFPGLEVVGGAYQAPSQSNQASNTVAEATDSLIKKKIPVIIDEPKFSGPILDQLPGNVRWTVILNITLIISILSFLGKFLFDIRNTFPWVHPSIYKEKLKNLAERGVNYSALEDLLLNYPRVESNISLKEKIEHLSLSPGNQNNLIKLLESLNLTYTNSKNSKNDDKDLWRHYKNDLCLLVQALENWESNKKNNNDESFE